MATLAQIFAADEAAQRDDGIPLTFTFASSTYTASATDFRNAKEEQDAGYLMQSDAELRIILSEFASPPVPNDTRLLTINSVSYRVNGVTYGQDTVSATLALMRNT